MDTAFSRFTTGGGGRNSNKTDVLVHTAAAVGPKDPVSSDALDGDAFLGSVHADVVGRALGREGIRAARRAPGGPWPSP